MDGLGRLHQSLGLRGGEKFMRIKRLVKRVADGVLGSVGLKIVVASRDLDNRPSGYAEMRMLRSLAEAFDGWCQSSTTWPVAQLDDTTAAVREFYASYLRSPFQSEDGGSRFNNLLWLHLVAKATQPSVIIDSGTFRGASAWAFATAMPQCPIYSFDIDLTSLAYKSPGVRYLEQDWASCDFGDCDMTRSLAYFDDHVDQGARLLEAADLGVTQVIFDDDFSVTSFARMAHDGNALPKIEFALDDELQSEPCLTWVTSRGAHRWAIDHAKLASMKSRIAATERLPNTSLLTGIHQTPYRLVLVRTNKDGGITAPSVSEA
jgi:hypothetical protein